MFAARGCSFAVASAAGAALASRWCLAGESEAPLIRPFLGAKRQTRHLRQSGVTARCEDLARAGPAAQILATPEPTVEALLEELLALPDEQRRAALSIVGLAAGDAAGLPFELRRGKWARAKFHKLNSDAAKKALVKDLVAKRCQRHGRNIFVRTFSDDTACCDLKMEAACQVGLLGGEAGEKELQLAVLQQYLKWAHGSKLKDTVGSTGPMFQGTGAFTRDFLVPFSGGRKNEAAQVMGHKPLYEDHPVMGPFWPTTEFASFAVDYFRGVFSFPSWGNGAVMSFAPHPVLAGRWRRGEEQPSTASIRAAAGVLSRSHQEPTAALAADLMWELLDAIYSGSVGTIQDLRQAVAHLPRTLELLTLQHECVPVDAFREWLETGDCEVATAQRFLQKLTGSREEFDVASGPYGVFGSMLHIAADWNDDHKTYLKRANSQEPVLFSQRGINSLIIAIWASSGALSPWEAFSRVIYVGGDTDTIGAVAGQVACPLLDPEEVVEAFVDFAGLGPDPEALPLKIASLASRRYFRRALLFAAGDLEGLRECPSLLEVSYPPFTAQLTKEVILDDLPE